MDSSKERNRRIFKENWKSIMELVGRDSVVCIILPEYFGVFF